MKHRIFLGILILVLILLNALQTSVLDASPLSDTPAILGTPFWELKMALSTGLFTAISMMAAAGIGSFFWLGLLPACGAGWAPETALLRLGRCGSWCAWPAAAGCIPGLSYYVYPWMREEYGNGALTGPVLMMGQMTISLIILMVLGYLLQGPSRYKAQLPAVFLSALVGLGCGMFWWWGKGLDFLVICLASSLSLIILMPHRPQIRPQLGALLAVSLALSVYVIGFGNMMTAYAPTSHFTPALPAASGTMLTASVITLILAGIFISLLPALKHRGKALARLPIILCGLLIILSIILSCPEQAHGTGETAQSLIPELTRWCAGLAAGLTILLSLSPHIRRSALWLKSAAALTLLLILCYAWLVMYTNASANGYDWPMGKVSTVCYILALALMFALGTAYYRLKAPNPADHSEGESKTKA